MGEGSVECKGQCDIKEMSELEWVVPSSRFSPAGEYPCGLRQFIFLSGPKSSQISNEVKFGN